MQRRESTTQTLAPECPPSAGTVKLDLPDGKSYELPILTPNCGKPQVDIRALNAQTGYFTFDPGFNSTCSCSSKISYIDGTNGILTHRGYRMEDLVENCTYIEVSYLLLYGELPGPRELADFEQMINDEMCVHTKMIELFQNFKSDAHPMAIMVSAVGSFSAFSTFLQQSYEMAEDDKEVQCIKMIAKMPMIAALAYRTAMVKILFLFF
jgi:citrate synthase